MGQIGPGFGYWQAALRFQTAAAPAKVTAGSVLVLASDDIHGLALGWPDLFSVFIQEAVGIELHDPRAVGAPVVRPAGSGEGRVANQKVSVFQEGVDEDVVAFRVILFILVVGDIPDNRSETIPSFLSSGASAG